MPDTARPRTGLQAPLGSADTVDTYDDTVLAAFDRIEDLMVIDDQGVLAARPPSTVSTPGVRGRYWRDEYGRVHRDNGTGWDTFTPAIPLITTSSELAALAPFDGQRVDFLADATAGIIWPLRYRASSPSVYKWECCGARALRQRTAGGSAGQSSTAFTYLVQPSAPALTLPPAGDYDVRLNVSAYLSVAGEIQFAFGDAATSIAGPYASGYSRGSGKPLPFHLEASLPARPAGSALKVWAATQGSGPTLTLREALLAAVPVRVK